MFCDTIINYTVTGLTGGTSIILEKDGFILQTIPCNSSCGGSVTDPNPATGTHKYTLTLPSGALITEATSYIYTKGTITSNFNSCAKSSLPANPNCDITLNINAPGVYPGSIVVTRDGVNWRIARCANPACTSTLTDPNPALGIHTYAIFDGVSKSRLARVTVNITAGNIGFPPDTVILCTGLNFTGNCLTIGGYQMPSSQPIHFIPDLTNSSIGNDTAVSMKSNIGRVYLCRDINYSGLCEGFGAGDYPDLSTHPIGINTASSILESSRLDRSYICSETNLNGTCEYLNFPTDDPDLTDNIIGNDNVSSMLVDGRNPRLCIDINYGGTCYSFPEGYYSNLGNLPIGDNQTSSIKW